MTMSVPELQSETRELKKKLRRSWAPFFSRFGRLLPAQMRAIPPILDGKDVFLTSATASGKTEAVVAPLAERIVEADSHLPLVVYVAPTRALVNDTQRRCQGQLEEMGISCLVRTGDRPHFTSRRTSKFLITTPESLDSLSSRIPDVFSSLATVVLDELHLTDKTYRGDQVRILLRRLSENKGSPVQVCGTSATMDEPEAMARRYSDSPIVIEAGGNREISETYFSSLSEVTEFLAENSRRVRKILFFGNSRRICEETAEGLRELLPEWGVMVHHGSLSKKEREGVEVRMRTSPRWMCCATMTLEVGIDIGDVDAVCLLEPPWSVASLLQRIGRSNRRESKITVLALAEQSDEKPLYEEQFARAREGLLDKRPYSPDLSVVVQQIFATLSGAPTGRTEEELRRPFARFCSNEQLGLIMRHLRDEGHLELRVGKWLASTETMDLAESGQVYSNIPNLPERRVVDGRSGQEIGRVLDAVDSTFMLAGRAWKVTGSEGDKIVVEGTTHGAKVALFRVQTDVGAFTKYLPPGLSGSAQAKERGLD